MALGYRTLPNNAIRELPIQKLQKNGFLFLWVVNSRYNFALECLEHWGYEYVTASRATDVGTNGTHAHNIGAPRNTDRHTHIHTNPTAQSG